jgi:hypothetical protein
MAPPTGLVFVDADSTATTTKCAITDTPNVPGAFPKMESEPLGVASAFLGRVFKVAYVKRPLLRRRCIDSLVAEDALGIGGFGKLAHLMLFGRALIQQDSIMLFICFMTASLFFGADTARGDEPRPTVTLDFDRLNDVGYRRLGGLELERRAVLRFIEEGFAVQRAPAVSTVTVTLRIEEPFVVIEAVSAG